MSDADLDGMRVLAFCDYYSPLSTGGAERVAREVCLRLARRGAAVSVISAVDLAPYRDADVAVTSVRAYDLSPYVKAQLALSPGYLRQALALAERFRPTVITTHSLHFQGSVVAARVARRLGLGLVTVAHVADLAHLGGLTRPLGEAHERTIGKWIIGRSDRLVAVSGAVRDHCIERGADPARVDIAYNGVDHALFSPSDEPLVDRPHIVFVGRLIANKGPGLLVDAARLLHGRKLAFRVTFVGDGALRGAIERGAVGLPVRCVGASSDVASWMRDANVVVRPSFTEGLPLTVLEAMASRRCVVASDIAANREVVENGVTGLLHRVGDAHSLADALEQLLRRPDQRTALADAGEIRARRYTWDNTARGHARALLGANATPRAFSPRVLAG
jgi:glycosyltransferase involved in cell wall biosynthesis